MLRQFSVALLTKYPLKSSTGVVTTEIQSNCEMCFIYVAVHDDDV